jgi:hypothetical protein
LTITLTDVQPLFGGQTLFLGRDGRGYCQIVSHDRNRAGLSEKRYKFAAREPARRLARMISEHSFGDIPSSAVSGRPDEARPSIAVRWASGRSVIVSRWQHDAHPDFDAIYQAMLPLVRSCERCGRLLATSPYDPAWAPEGFALP